MPDDDDNSPGASTPHVEPLLVIYGGPQNFWGDAVSVAKINHTNRLFDFLGMLTIAVLIGATCALTTVLAILAPNDRGFLVWAIAIVSWILAIGLGGFAAFQIRVTSGGIHVSGGAVRQPTRPGAQAASPAQQVRGRGRE
ncbi:hypothetical protein ACELLULO517_12070 [Acidisoma cellulosilytica]|uniref:Uncharacterized protein n=1 Tax=Acidisoma cellulosilyticum TaxID=2802395 RepID=A0A963Z370_9PROT|nr:hypothetical protein [Acidisoma cellulosilyticum]MCB8880973.1 hypothetical protein [Acidisoma cellulosilyticum]